MWTTAGFAVSILILIGASEASLIFKPHRDFGVICLEKIRGPVPRLRGSGTGKDLQASDLHRDEAVEIRNKMKSEVKLQDTEVVMCTLKLNKTLVQHLTTSVI